MPPTAIPNLVSLDACPGLAVSLAHGRLSTLRQVTLRVTSTLYDGLRPAAIFGALFGPGGGQVKVLCLVLAPDVDRRARGWLLGALAKTGEGLEVLELQLEGTSDEVRSPPQPSVSKLTCSSYARFVGRIAGAVQASRHAFTQCARAPHTSVTC